MFLSLIKNVIYRHTTKIAYTLPRIACSWSISLPWTRVAPRGPDCRTRWSHSERGRMSVGVWCVTDLRLGDEATVRKAIAGPEGRCRREACCTRASVHTVPSAHLVVPEREWWSRVPCPVPRRTMEEQDRAHHGGRPHSVIQNLTGVFGFFSYKKYCI